MKKEKQVLQMPQEMPGGNERILLVDDEQHILEVFSELLRLHGYTVTTFLDSREALHHFRENPLGYDLVITDMTMPFLSGDILGKEMKIIRPDLAVILCTGFSNTISRKQCLQEGFAAYLIKPVDVQHLLLTVRETLDSLPSGTLQILLVEDDSFNQDIATMLLQELGHRVVVAENGEIALQKLAEQEFDCIFMDIQMPVLDGLQTTEILRACESNGPKAKEFERRTGCKADRLRGIHIPVIAMTGYLDEKARRECQQAGMDDFLGKPFTMEVLEPVLQKIDQAPTHATPVPGDFGVGRSDESMPFCTGNDMSAVVLAHLQAAYPLEAEQVQQILESSVRSLRESLQEAAQALEQDDLVALASATHKVKGTLLGLGLEAQVKLARTLELSVKNGEVQEYVPLMGQLTRSLQSLLSKDTP